MRGTHTRCHPTAGEYGAPGDLVLGADVAGFLEWPRRSTRTGSSDRAETGRRPDAAGLSWPAKAGG
jgi:hypothetical protein